MEVTTLILLTYLLPSIVAVTNYTALVSGYNDKISRLIIYQTHSGPEMTAVGTWDVDKDMTWLQVEGDVSKPILPPSSSLFFLCFLPINKGSLCLTILLEKMIKKI